MRASKFVARFLIGIAISAWVVPAFAQSPDPLPRKAINHSGVYRFSGKTAMLPFASHISRRAARYTLTISMLLASPSAEGSLTGTGHGTGTINDNDPGPVFSTASVTVSESAGTADFTVTKTGATTQNYTVNYATSNNTASSGSDYTSTSGTLAFLANETTKVVQVPIINNATPESTEKFAFLLPSPSSGASVASGSIYGTITDDD